MEPPKESNETDPLKKNLIDTINQYEWLLSQNKFSDKTERDTTEKTCRFFEKATKRIWTEENTKFK